MEQELKPTEEQQAIIAATRTTKESLLIQAYAGAAKTTTLTMAAKEVRQGALALAFNKNIQMELKQRFPSHFEVSTMNGFGFKALLRSRPGVKFDVDQRKLGRLVSQITKEFKTELSEDQWAELRQLVQKAMNVGLVPGDEGEPLVEDSADTWQWLATEVGIPMDEIGMQSEIAREIIKRDIDEALAGRISFDDQVYIPAVLSGKFPQFPVLMVDEAQDLSPLNHVLLRKAIRPDGRLIVCGDALQSIYAFRGADSESIERIKALRAKWIELPLTMTFRCPKAIVERQLWHAKGFRAFEGNKQGKFVKLPELDAGQWLDKQEAMKDGVEPDEPVTWDWATVRAHAKAGEKIAVLCRNNAPLLKLVFKLLRQRISVQMLGRDIGPGLISMSKKLLPDDDMRKLDALDRVAEWKESEVTAAIAAKQEDKVDGIEDKAECLIAVLSYDTVKSVGDLRRELKTLFERTALEGMVTLSTVHKAKGLEWDVVLFLDPWRVPSKWAKKKAALGDDRALRQELNLKYVAETRTKNVLIHASMDDFEKA